MSGGVFISYRRDDSPGAAGRIYDRLANRLGREKVFFDIDSIGLGVDFVDVLWKSVGKCDALVVVIGKNWVSSAGKDNRRRLDESNDFVRIEIEAALERDIPVIPVLVDGADMPRTEDLPDGLKKLTRRNGIEISHTRFDFDVERLTHALSLIEDEIRQREEAAEAERAAREERERLAAAEAAEKAERARVEAEAARKAEEERRAREAAEAERAAREERERLAAAEAAEKAEKARVEAEAVEKAEQAGRLAEAEAARRAEEERLAKEASETERAARREREKREAVAAERAGRDRLKTEGAGAEKAADAARRLGEEPQAAEAWAEWKQGARSERIASSRDLEGAAVETGGEAATTTPEPLGSAVRPQPRNWHLIAAIAGAVIVGAILLLIAEFGQRQASTPIPHFAARLMQRFGGSAVVGGVFG